MTALQQGTHIRPAQLQAKRGEATAYAYSVSGVLIATIPKVTGWWVTDAGWPSFTPNKNSINRIERAIRKNIILHYQGGGYVTYV